MPLPSIIETAHAHLFSDRDKMRDAGVPDITARHIERLRDIYSYWLAFPSKRDREIVMELRRRYSISDSTAREDLRVIKTLLGDFQKSTKDYHRYRAEQWLSNAYEKAEKAGNTRDMVAAAAQYSRTFQLDKDDERADIADSVVPVQLVFTDNPEVIGLKRVPDVRRKIEDLKRKYWAEATEEVDFEEVDADVDNIFRRNGKGYGAPDAAGIPE